MSKAPSCSLQAAYGLNMPGGADRLPEQTLEQGMGEVGSPQLHQGLHQGQAEIGEGVSATGTGLMSSKV